MCGGGQNAGCTGGKMIQLALTLFGFLFIILAVFAVPWATADLGVMDVEIFMGQSCYEWKEFSMSSWGRRLSEEKQLELEHALPKAVVRRLYGNDYRQDACYHWFDEEAEDTIEEYPLLLVGYLNGLLALIIVLVAMILAWVYLCTGNPCCANSCCRCCGRCLAITSTTWCVIALVLWQIGFSMMVDDQTGAFDVNPYDTAAGPFLMVIGAICVLLTTILETKLMGPPVATPATTTVQIMPAAQVHSAAP